MPGTARNKGQRERDRATLAEMLCRGRSRADMATAIGVSLPTVYNELAAIRSGWREQAHQRYGDGLAEAAARVEAIWEEAWANYRAAGLGTPAAARFLKVAADAAASMAKVLGVSGPPPAPPTPPPPPPTSEEVTAQQMNDAEQCVEVAAILLECGAAAPPRPWIVPPTVTRVVDATPSEDRPTLVTMTPTRSDDASKTAADGQST